LQTVKPIPKKTLTDPLILNLTADFGPSGFAADGLQHHYRQLPGRQPTAGHQLTTTSFASDTDPAFSDL